MAGYARANNPNKAEVRKPPDDGLVLPGREMRLVLGPMQLLVEGGQMNKLNMDQISDQPDEDMDSGEADVREQAHPERRLAFLVPKLVKVGELNEITSGFSI